MPRAILRLSPILRRALRELAQRRHKTMRGVLEEAVEQYRRQQFLEDANRAYASLRRGKRAWREEIRERAAWEACLADGLKGD